jgi:hypothetical protein
MNENLNKLKAFLKSWKFWKSMILIGAGGLAGFLYYYFVGCKSGSCPITGNPYMSILWGGLLGFFLINSPCSQNKC